MEEIKLEGSKNIRDISYQNIKEKKLIRSDALNKLTKEDIKILLNEYNIKTVIDLRTKKERRNKDVKISGVSYYSIPLLPSHELGITRGEDAFIQFPTTIPNLTEIYKKFVTYDKRGAWTKIFDIISHEHDGAILWHCTVGKDRCGIVSAMIEYALGLSEAEIMNDYLLTNNYIEIPFKYKLALLFLNNKEAFRNIFLAKREYLESAFEEIDKLYGNKDIFLEAVCGVNEEKKEQIRKLYLK